MWALIGWLFVLAVTVTMTKSRMVAAAAAAAAGGGEHSGSRLHDSHRKLKSVCNNCHGHHVCGCIRRVYPADDGMYV